MCSRTTILLSAVILLLSVVACQKAKKADGSKDLLLASMQTTIAELTGVVGQQTKAISEVMIWLSEAKVEFEKLQSNMEDNNKMLIANSTKERAELSTKFFEQLAVLNNKLTDSDNNTTAKLVELQNLWKDEAASAENNTSAKMEDLASKLNESKLETEELRETLANVTNETEDLASKLKESKLETEQLRKTLSNAEETIEDLASKEDLASNVNELKNNITTELDEVKTTISNIGSEVEIVSSEEEGGNPKCAKVCTGTTGRTTTSWKFDSSISVCIVGVTIQECGFVKVPTVTTSIEGSSNHYQVTGASAVYSVTTSSFTICLKGDSNTASNARSYGWNVEWIAVGYTC